jgi:uncharacterized membrane protein
MEPYELLGTFFAAMTPVGELRLSIPLAVVRMEVPWQQALAVSLAGNMVPVLLLVPGLERLSRLLLRFQNPVGRFLSWRTDRLRRSHAGAFHRYGAVALVALVAIPLPLTGAWTGSLAAWAFMIPARKAIPLIALGVLIAGIVVTALTMAGVTLGSMLAEPGA